MGKRYTLYIDAFSPRTIPMARLAQYMQNFAALLGHESAVRLQGLESGSTRIVTAVDLEYVPKVDRRLEQARRGEGSHEAIRAKTGIDRLLAGDNATGFIYAGEDESARIIPFPGVTGLEAGDLVRQDETSPYKDYGTLEGTLRTISDETGGVKIRIQDPLWKGTIPCHTSDDQIEKALGAFRRRVEVAGLIHYNELGRPISIRMDNLTVLPEDKELPTAADIRGLFIEPA
ncbi:MAG: hypothetical protein GDA39_00515 [Hyphomonadaceae bacterium]|nr:hypothetical protein [Hyphomonadaceae bacterium]